MQPRSADNREANWAWAIWCLAPAAALMLCVSRVPLWLTMPAAPENDAMTWVLMAQALSLFALGPFFTRFRDATSAALTALTFLTLGWLASQQSGRSYLVAAAILIAVLYLLHATKRLVGRINILMSAAIMATALYTLIW